MRQIFINLAVKDVQRSRKFWEALGFSFNPQFSGDKTACLVIEEGSIQAMLMTHEMYGSFTPKAIIDPKKQSQVLLTFTCSSDQEVKDLAAKALASGGAHVHDPEDHGFMYHHAFEDPDGHGWGLVHMRGNPA